MFWHSHSSFKKELCHRKINTDFIFRKWSVFWSARSKPQNLNYMNAALATGDEQESTNDKQIIAKLHHWVPVSHGDFFINRLQINMRFKTMTETCFRFSRNRYEIVAADFLYSVWARNRINLTTGCHIQAANMLAWWRLWSAGGKAILSTETDLTLMHDGCTF